MSCSFNLRSKFLSGVTAGGSWEFVGYSSFPTGPFVPNDNWVWDSIANDDPLVDFGSIPQGYYKLNYFLAGPCGGSREIVIPVTGNGDAGVTKSISTCISSGIIDIATELQSQFDGGVLQPSFSFEGSGVDSAGYIQGNVNTPMDDQFDPSLVAAGSYLIILTITPQEPEGYTLEDCCVPTTATLIINVSEATLEIEIDDSCHITLVSDEGCEGATFELYKSLDSGSTWIATGITSLPYQAQENALYKWVGSGCSCGDVDSNIVDSTGCCNNSTLTMYFDDDFCAFFIIGGLGCSNGVFKWYRSCDGEQTWEHQPQHDGDDFIFVNDDCCWQVIKEDCSNGCQDYSNVDCASGCAGGCNGALGGSTLPCVYRVASGTYCAGGTLKLVKQGSGVVSTVALTGSNQYPIDFPITSDGTYYALLDCDDGCPDYVGPTFTYTGCNSDPVCDSVASLTLSGCFLIGSVSNCPNPIYTFKRPDGSIAQSGSSNFYQAIVSGIWTLEVVGCPDCGLLTDTVTVPANCNDTSCNCSVSLINDDCGQLLVSANNCSGYNVRFEFRPDSSTAWVTVQDGLDIFHAAAENGEYRAVLYKAGCSDAITNITTVTCISTDCNCGVSITIDQDTCEISYSVNGCVGFALQFEELLNNVWVNAGPQNPSNPYTPQSNNLHRLVATKNGCSDRYSNVVEPQCGSCQVSIDQMYVDPNDCSKVIVDWSGAGGSNVSVQFTRATVNTSDCVNAGGWSTLNGVQQTSAISNGTGTSSIELSQAECDTCIRAIVNATAEGCGQDVEKVFAPCCCTDEPGIDESEVQDDYQLILENPDSSTSFMKLGWNGSSYFWEMRKRVTLNGIDLVNELVQSSSFDLVQLSRSQDISTYKFLWDLKVTDGTTDFDFNLSPLTSVYLSGNSGTVSANDLYLDISNDLITVWKPACITHIENAIHAEYGYVNGVEYDFGIDIGSDGSNDTILIWFRVQESAGTWLGLRDISGATRYRKNPSGTTSQNPYLVTYDGNPEISESYSTPCSSVSSVAKHPDHPTWQWESGEPLQQVLTASAPRVGVIPFSINGNAANPTVTCFKNILTVSSECAGATYLWSTGATTNSIEVYSGTYTVVVTCTDGCEYTLTITV